MLKLRKIAITGGLAAGKTTVCQLFKELGAYVLSADDLVHQLLSPQTHIGKRVIQLLGEDILSGSTIDRKKVSEKVFSQPEKLHALEQILHPAVFDEIKNSYEQIEKQGKYPFFVAEIPLLYEAGRAEEFDAIITVVAEPEVCKRRFLQDGKHTELEFTERMTRQWNTREKAKRADYVLDNNGTIADLKAQVELLFSNLTFP